MQYDRGLSSTTQEVYTSSVKRKGLSEDIVTLSTGTNVLWLGKRSSPYVLLWLHGECRRASSPYSKNNDTPGIQVVDIQRKLATFTWLYGSI
jgi:hypothetical protein